MKIENVEVRDIAKEFGTPVYVYSMEHSSPFDWRDQAIGPCYPVCHESLIRMFAFLKKCSTTESKLTQSAFLKCNVPCERDSAPTTSVSPAMFFSTIEDVKFCLENNIYCNCGTLGMVEEYGKALKAKGSGSSKISIRINPGEGAGHSKKTNTGGPYSKHGIWHQNLDEVKRSMPREYDLTYFRCAYAHWVWRRYGTPQTHHRKTGGVCQTV